MSLLFDPRHLIQFYAMVLLSVALIASFRRHLPFHYSAGWIYFSIICAAQAWSPLWSAPYFNPIENLSAQYNSLQVWTLLLLLPFGVLALKTQHILNSCVLFLCVDAVWLWFKPFGLLNANTFDASIMALFLPHVLFHYQKRWLAGIITALFISVILSCFAKTAMLSIAVMIISVVFLMNRKKTAASLMAGLAGVCITMYYFDIAGAGRASGRYEIWEAYGKIWNQTVNKWVGAGLGTLEILGRKILMVDEAGRKSITYNLHNNYLQIMFESGSIGLTFLGMMFTRFFIEAKKKPWCFTTGSGFAVAMIFYAPMNSIIGQLLLCCLLKEVIFNQPVTEGKCNLYSKLKT